MPHCTLESSDNIVDIIDKREILLKINKCLADTGLFNLNDIKSRFVTHTDYVIGDGDADRAFVTLNISILSGRDASLKAMLSNKCLELLQPFFPESFKRLKFSLTVQISELDKDSYSKAKSY